jgi:hypothetical protein
MELRASFESSANFRAAARAARACSRTEDFAALAGALLIA